MSDDSRFDAPTGCRTNTHTAPPIASATATRSPGSAAKLRALRWLVNTTDSSKITAPMNVRPFAAFHLSRKFDCDAHCASLSNSGSPRPSISRTVAARKHEIVVELLSPYTMATMKMNAMMTSTPFVTGYADGRPVGEHSCDHDHCTADAISRNAAASRNAAPRIDKMRDRTFAAGAEKPSR